MKNERKFESISFSCLHLIKQALQGLSEKLSTVKRMETKKDQYLSQEL